MTALAADLGATRPGAYLRPADALLRAADDRALALARDIVGWAENHDPGGLDAPGVPAAVKGAHVLAEGVLETAG